MPIHRGDITPFAHAAPLELDIVPNANRPLRSAIASLTDPKSSPLVIPYFFVPFTDSTVHDIRSGSDLASCLARCRSGTLAAYRNSEESRDRSGRLHQRGTGRSPFRFAVTPLPCLGCLKVAVFSFLGLLGLRGSMAPAGLPPTVTLSETTRLARRRVHQVPMSSPLLRSHMRWISSASSASMRFLLALRSARAKRRRLN